jgi:2-polyprenyl-3-methyl-5-hydroxy-6-metoxy-1,4-benzoquinol methylase
MSSLALMRWLEGAPERYDAGMRILSFGRVGAVHAAVAAAAVSKHGDRVLEIGCGTGAVSARLTARGAFVTALDQAPEMLEQAKKRLGDEASVEWLEQTAAEIDRLPEHSYESVVLSFCLSDMSTSERRFVLRESARRLKPGGKLVVADEVWATGWRRLLQRVWRIPQAAIGWLLVGAVSHPLASLADEVRAAGLRIQREERWLGETLGLVVAESSHD